MPGARLTRPIPSFLTHGSGSRSHTLHPLCEVAGSPLPTRYWPRRCSRPLAMPFTRMDHGLAAGQAVECPSESAAIRRAEALSRHAAYAGAVAFSRSGDPNRAEIEDAIILKTFGGVPDDFRLV